MQREWVRNLIEKFSASTMSAVKVTDFLNDKQLHIPSKLFKIRTCSKFALENLASKTLHLSVAEDFNDPYDTAFWVDFNRLMAEEAVSSFGFSEDEIATALSVPDPMQGAYELTMEHLERNLEMGEFILSHRPIADKYQNEILPKLIHDLKTSYKICSLSERIDSMLMWSHYGYNHTGFAMEYDYTRLHRNHPSTLSLWPVAYTDKLIDITDIVRVQRHRGDFNNLFGVPASLCKAMDWQYEHEWRLVWPDGQEERGMSMPAPLKAVHLGARIAPEDEEKIIGICSTLDIPVFKMTLAPHEYRMISEPIKHESAARLD